MSPNTVVVWPEVVCSVAVILFMLLLHQGRRLSSGREMEVEVLTPIAFNVLVLATFNSILIAWHLWMAVHDPTHYVWDGYQLAMAILSLGAIYYTKPEWRRLAKMLRIGSPS